MRIFRMRNIKRVQYNQLDLKTWLVQMFRHHTSGPNKYNDLARDSGKMVRAIL